MATPSRKLPRDAFKPLRACCRSSITCLSANAFVVAGLLSLPFVFAISLIAYSSSLQYSFPPAQSSWRTAVGSLMLIDTVIAAPALYWRLQNVLLLCGWGLSVLSYWLMVVFTLDLTSVYNLCGSWSCTGGSASSASVYARMDVAPGLDATACVLGLIVGAVLSARGQRIATEIESTLAAARTLGITDSDGLAPSGAAPPRPFAPDASAGNAA